MMLSKYLVAYSLPLMLAVLWRMGGAEGYSLNWRRVGGPLVLFAWALISGVWWVWALLSAASLYGVTILPITLVGNTLDTEKDKSKQLWWWIPILGLLYGLTLQPLGWTGSWIFGLIVGLMVAFSYWFLVLMTQLPSYEKTLRWHWYENMFGAAYGLGCVLVVWGGV